MRNIKVLYAIEEMGLINPDISIVKKQTKEANFS